MQTASANAPQKRPTGPNQKPRRQLKNFLLLRGFQLRYTGFIVGVSAILCAALGMVIYQRTQEAYKQSKEALEAAESAHASAQDANKAAHEASKMLYLDELLSDPEAAEEEVAKADAAYEKREKETQAKVQEMRQRKAEIETKANRTLFYLGGLLGVLVLALAIFGIVVTHKVAGPLFVMGRMFEGITRGDFRLQKRSLRKGDQLTDLFQKGVEAVQSLHDQATSDLRVLEKSLALVKRLSENGADPQLTKQLEENIRQVALHKARAIGKELSS